MPDIPLASNSMKSFANVLYMRGILTPHNPFLHLLVDEVEAEEVQQQTAKDVVGERSEGNALATDGGVWNRRVVCTSRARSWESPACWPGSIGYVGRPHNVSSRPQNRRAHSLVRTNCPTVPQKPDKKALNGCGRLAHRHLAIRSQHARSFQPRHSTGTAVLRQQLGIQGNHPEAWCAGASWFCNDRIR